MIIIIDQTNYMLFAKTAASKSIGTLSVVRRQRNSHVIAVTAILDKFDITLEVRKIHSIALCLTLR